MGVNEKVRDKEERKRRKKSSTLTLLLSLPSVYRRRYEVYVGVMHVFVI